MTPACQESSYQAIERLIAAYVGSA